MFGIDLWDASLGPSLLVAVTAGVLSFLSPCVLPIVPPYLAFMAGASMEEMEGRRRAHVLRAACFFVLGLSTVFLLLGLAASALGRTLLAWQEQMTFVAGAVIVIFGLHFLGVLRCAYDPRAESARDSELRSSVEDVSGSGGAIAAIAVADEKRLHDGPPGGDPSRRDATGAVIWCGDALLYASRRT
jgi:cytochrome c-type biogenesis protein